jgi:hypothetical protein
MKTVNKLSIILLANSFLTTGAMAKSGDAIHLAQNGKTSYVITLASDAIPAEKTAATELQKYLQQVTGAPFLVKSETAVNANTPQILVGVGTRVKGLLPRQDWNSLGTDGIVLKSVGKNLILAGGRTRGSLYAVYEFLEGSVGCRWWAPGAQTIPSTKSLKVKPLNTVYVPPFRYREDDTTDLKVDPVFATQMRENGHYQSQTEEWGGHYSILGFCHTFNQLLPVHENFKAHPEWYGDPANGDKPCTPNSVEPDYHTTQPDLTNPEVLEAMTKAALAWIDANPEAKYISISQNDGGSFCMTPEAKAIIEREGAISGLLIQFVNKVAARIHEKYPNILVETLAYSATLSPPKNIRPARNVIIRFAPIHRDFGHPFESESNRKSREMFNTWASISSQVFMWNYNSNFTTIMYPHPNWDGLAKDLRYFAANKVTGVFEEGDCYTNNLSDFVHLRAWLMGKLMWNPHQDQDKLIAEFLDGYYGAAGPHLRSYLYAVLKAFRATGRGLGTNNTDLSFFDLDLTNESIRLFQKAATAVKGDKVLEDRVARQRLTFEIALLQRYKFLKKASLAQGKEFLGPKDPEEALKVFMATVRKLGLPNMAWAGLDEDFEKAKAIFDMPVSTAPLPDFAKNYAAEDVIDLQEAEFRLYSPGKLTDVTDDVKATDGRAAWTLGNAATWAIQVPLGKVLDRSDGRWQVYAMMRAETDANAGIEGSADMTYGLPVAGSAFDMAAYDPGTNQSYAGTPPGKGAVSAGLEALQGARYPLAPLESPDYQRIDLGVHELNPGMFLFFAPTNPVVKKIYIDRVILIRQK